VYWRLTISGTAFEQRVYVDGIPDLVFILAGNYPHSPHHAPITVSSLNGQRDYPLQIRTAHALDLIGVRLRAGSLAAFVPFALVQVRNQVVELADLFGRAARVLEAQLYDQRLDFAAQGALLDAFLLARLQVPAAYALVQDLAARLQAAQGNLTMADLSRSVGYSQRTLDRLFAQIMGYPPKFYARIQRFQHALSLLQHTPPLSLTEIAFACGYYDQAHFSKEVKAFSGQTPEQHSLQPAQNVQFLQDS
jgi:AraC-like DNA-binding protein